MKISVKVKPNSKSERIEKISETEFILSVNVPAKEDKANKRALELLSEHFDVGKNRIIIIKGHKNKNKIIEVVS